MSLSCVQHLRDQLQSCMREGDWVPTHAFHTIPITHNIWFAPPLLSTRTIFSLILHPSSPVVTAVNIGRVQSDRLSAAKLDKQVLNQLCSACTALSSNLNSQISLLSSQIQTDSNDRTDYWTEQNESTAAFVAGNDIMHDYIRKPYQTGN